MAEAMSRKAEKDRGIDDEISRDDPLFELSQIIGYSPEKKKSSEPSGHGADQLDLEDALVAELEDDLTSYEVEETPPLAYEDDDIEIDLESLASEFEQGVVADVAPEFAIEAEAEPALDPERETASDLAVKADALEDELLELLGGLGGKTHVAPEWEDATDAPEAEETADPEPEEIYEAPLEASDVDETFVAAEPEDPAEPEVELEPAAAVADNVVPFWSAGGFSADDADDVEFLSEEDAAQLEDEAILDQFESALNDDLALAFEDVDDFTEVPEEGIEVAQEPESALEESGADAARNEAFAWDSQEDELIEALTETLSEEAGSPQETYKRSFGEAPFLQTAEMPVGDIEQMPTLELPDLPEMDDAGSDALDIERELDAAIAGFDQNDEPPAEERTRNAALFGAPETPSPAESDISSDIDLSKFEQDLARDLEFVQHDLRAGEDGDSDVAATLPETEIVEEVEPRPRRGMMIAAVVGGIAILGAIGAFGLLAGGTVEDSGPVLVKADSEPVKIVPDDPGGKQVPNQDRAVYGEVDGNTAQEPTQETLVTTSEEPIDLGAGSDSALPAAVSETAKLEERLTPESIIESAIDQISSGAPVLTPRRVRTVIVKPDGTFVAKPEAPVESAAVENPAPARMEPVAPAPDASAPVAQASAPATSDSAGEVRTIEIAPQENAPSATVAEVSAEEQPPATEIVAAAENRTDQATEVTGVDARAAEEIADAEVAALQPQNDASPVVAEPVASEAQRVEETQAVTRQLLPPRTVPDRPASQPLNVVGGETRTAAAPRQPAPAVSAPTSDYTVQIASLPNPELAQSTANTLSNRYANLLGGRSITIQRAEIEGRGTFHRVRVSTAGRDDAVQLCERYKAAGGSCFVAR
jgi:hypothetical protein